MKEGLFYAFNADTLMHEVRLTYRRGKMLLQKTVKSFGSKDLALGYIDTHYFNSIN